MYQNRVKLIGKRRACKEVDPPVEKNIHQCKQKQFSEIFHDWFYTKKKRRNENSEKQCC